MIPSTGFHDWHFLLSQWWWQHCCWDTVQKCCQNRWRQKKKYWQECRRLCWRGYKIITYCRVSNTVILVVDQQATPSWIDLQDLSMYLPHFEHTSCRCFSYRVVINCIMFLCQRGFGHTRILDHALIIAKYLGRAFQWYSKYPQFVTHRNHD